MFGNMFKAMQWEDELHRKFKGKAAADHGEKVCRKCGKCCHVKPCALDAVDLKRLAEHFKMTPSDFFKKYCVVDEIKGGLTITPCRAKQTDLVGRYVPSDRTWDSEGCIFWDKIEGCKVYAVRPESASRVVCGDETTVYVPLWEKQDMMDLGWDGVDDYDDSYEQYDEEGG